MKPICVGVVILVLSNFNANASNWNSGGSATVTSSTNIRLNCEVTNYNLSEYPEKWSKSWVPPSYSLIVSGGKVELVGKTATGRITRDTPERLEVIFDAEKDTRNDGGFLKGIYFKSNNKFMARVGFRGGYRDSGPIWGVCQETSLSSSNSVPAPSRTSSSNIDKAKSTCTDLGFNAGSEKHGECVLKLFGQNDEATSIINTPRWLKVRQSGSSDLYVDKKGQYIKIKAASKWYNQLHDRYSKEPNTDIRIGFYFTNDKSYKPKKYDFETIKPSEIQATEEGNAKVFTFKTTAVAKLRSLESKYIIFLVTDFEKGMYFWTRTTKSN